MSQAIWPSQIWRDQWTGLCGQRRHGHDHSHQQRLYSAARAGDRKQFRAGGALGIDNPRLCKQRRCFGGFRLRRGGATGLQVVNVSDRRSPAIVGSLDTPGNANDVRIVGNRAYIADGSAGLQIIDVSSPTNPALIGSVDTPGEAQDVIVSGSRAYVADGHPAFR